MIDRLDAIERTLQQIAPFVQAVAVLYSDYSRIGHNKPPEDIDMMPLDSEGVQLAIIAANLARAEITAEHPRFDVIRVCARALSEMGKRFFALTQWMGRNANLFAEAYAKAAGEEAGKRTIQAIIAIGGLGAAMKLLTQLHVLLPEVLTALRPNLRGFSPSTLGGTTQSSEPVDRTDPGLNGDFRPVSVIALPLTSCAVLLDPFL